MTLVATPSPSVFAGRLESLDALRGVAILLVIGHHAAFRFDSGDSDWVALFLKNSGWAGVDIFFAISGLLIAKILVKDAERGDISGFLRRRFFRIVPLFTIAIITFLFASIASGRGLDGLSLIWVPALLLNGWLIPIYGLEEVPYTIIWSLSVEETAYLLFSLAVVWGYRSLRLVVMCLVIVPILVRLFVLWFQPFEPALLYYFVPARLDAIAFGALGAFGLWGVATRFKWSARVFGVATMAMLFVFAIWRSPDFWWPLVGYSCFGLICSIWVSCLADGSGSSVSLLKPLVAIGRVSYFVYLFHMFFLEAIGIAWTLSAAGKPPFWPATIVATTLCFIAARISWQRFELPLIRHGQKTRRSGKMERVGP